MSEVRKLSLAEEGMLALERGDLTFRSQWPCERFHLAERATHSLECVECAKLRRAKRDAANTKRKGMTKYYVHPPGQTRADTPEEKQRRIDNANVARERTRKAREALDAERAAKPVPTWYVPSNLLKEKL